MSIQIKTLRLTNFRCFGEADIAFHPKLSVIAADNGMGKTALMDAAAIVLAEFVDALTGVRQSPGILTSDVRAIGNGTLTPSSTRLEVEAAITGSAISWSLERKSAATTMRRSPKNLASMTQAAAGLVADDSETVAPTVLPVIAHYASTRFSQNAYFGDKSAKPIKPLEGRLDGYADFLDPLADATHFNRWYSDRVGSVASHAPTGATGKSVPLAQLSAVRKAVGTVLKPTGWDVIDWDSQRHCVVVEHSKRGRMPLAWLSSGVRSMLALTADLAHRCATLNPNLGEDAAERSPGIVLVDEIDLHLHPSWQQRVIELMQSAFAGVQFVVTTHSPQVLSTVHVDSVRVVRHRDEDSYVDQPKFQTRGVESADVLSEIMGVDPIPQVEESKALQRYRKLIEIDGAVSDEGRSLKAMLINHFGEHHPLMLDCERLARFVAFKRKQKSEGTN
jgi:predicted ATP-binding protein involved in virulence